MKRLLFAAVALTMFSACETQLFDCVRGEGERETRVIDVDTFTGIEMQGDMHVVFVEADTQSVEITAQKNVIDAIVANSDVFNETWEIKIANCTRNLKKVEIVISLPELTSVEVSGDGDIRTDGVFKNATEIELKCSGDGIFKMEFDSLERIQMITEGDAEYEIAGFAELQEIDVKGDSHILNFALETNTTEIKVKGDADCEVLVNDVLDVDIQGDGDICFRGNPTVTTDISGDGRVTDCN